MVGAVFYFCVTANTVGKIHSAREIQPVFVIVDGNLVFNQNWHHHRKHSEFRFLVIAQVKNPWLNNAVFIFADGNRVLQPVVLHLKPNSRYNPQIIAVSLQTKTFLKQIQVKGIRQQQVVVHKLQVITRVIFLHQSIKTEIESNPVSRELILKKVETFAVKSIHHHIFQQFFGTFPYRDNGIGFLGKRHCQAQKHKS